MRDTPKWIGFTGTRKGLTEDQHKAIRVWIEDRRNAQEEDFLCHGDCIGADAEAHRIGLEFHCNIHVFPPKNKSYRAFCSTGDRVFVHDEADYLKRNRAIVDACSVLLAAPKEATEQPTGGTWYTIRYARQQRKQIVIFLPDGTLKSEGGK